MPTQADFRDPELAELIRSKGWMVWPAIPFSYRTIGFYGGTIDLLFQRFIEIWSGMPQLYLLIILSSMITPSFWILLLFLLLFSWMALTGVVRAEFLRGRNLEYVRAARALGVSNLAVMWRHILPNAMVATLTFLPFTLSGSVTILASLDFLGFGLPPGSPSLGELVAQGKDNLQAPWLALTAFVVLGGTLTLLIFIGEAVRDAFDPRRVFKNPQHAYTKMLLGAEPKGRPKPLPPSPAVLVEARDIRVHFAIRRGALRRIIVFQDPFGSLSPRLTVGDIVAEGLRVHARDLDRTERQRRVDAALEEVGLPDGSAEGPADELFDAPKHDYTRALMAAAFELEPDATGVVSS
eukprot:gene12805-12903_t